MGGAASKAARRYPSTKPAVADTARVERIYPPAAIGAAELEVPVAAFSAPGDAPLRGPIRRSTPSASPCCCRSKPSAVAMSIPARALCRCSQHGFLFLQARQYMRFPDSGMMLHSRRQTCRMTRVSGIPIIHRPTHWIDLRGQSPTAMPASSHSRFALCVIIVAGSVIEYRSLCCVSANL